jgi:hypothetical protein
VRARRNLRIPGQRSGGWDDVAAHRGYTAAHCPEAQNVIDELVDEYVDDEDQLSDQE